MERCVEAPSSKLQAPGKHQTPRSKVTSCCHAIFGIWGLELLWILDLGVWSFSRDLEFGIFILGFLKRPLRFRTGWKMCGSVLADGRNWRREIACRPAAFGNRSPQNPIPTQSIGR